MHGRSALLTVAVAAAALALVACGDGNPASPSGTGNVVVRGVLLGEGAAFTSSSAGEASSNGGPITVMVEDTPISVTISGNGTFKLEGLPPGTFTLVFLQGGEEIGHITITAPEGAQVKVLVKKKGSIIVLIELEVDDDDENTSKTCVINGGRVGDRVELEGEVSSGGGTSFEMEVNGNRASGPVTVDAFGASFKCNGKTGGDNCKGAVQPRAKVHVRGMLTSCAVNDTLVKASEVKVQKAAP